MAVICSNNATIAEEDRLVSMARASREALEARYRAQRPRVSDDQAGEILRLFCHGKDSGEVAFESHTPIETVRAIISYACTISLDLYRWHVDAKYGTFASNNPPPANAVSYNHYAPPA